MEKSKLIKVSTYARQEDISVPAVYKRINAGSVECVEIDGVKFIKVNNDGKYENQPQRLGTRNVRRWRIRW